MKKGLPTAIKLIPILFALLAGQAAGLIHDADHPFHESNAVCDAFLALDKTDHTPLTSTNEFVFPGKHPLARFHATNRITSGPVSAYQPRAPPFSP